MAGFLTPAAEKYSRRYFHAGMQAWEENGSLLKADGLIGIKFGAVGESFPFNFHVEMGKIGRKCPREVSKKNPKITEFLETENHSTENSGRKIKRKIKISL